jgi:ribosomal protein S18 acetylase RimI-like enzyme
MIEIRPLTRLDAQDVERVTGAYTCYQTYRVVHVDSEAGASFVLELVPLAEPYVGRYDHFDEETLARYNRLLAGGFSFGAYDGEALVGILVAEAQAWNASLSVWEFHVAAAYRRQGTGRRLMERAIEQARQAGLRVVVAETQNRNASAIRAYRRLGFRLEGIDISYYTNDDYPDRGIAVFMKRRLA